MEVCMNIQCKLHNLEIEYICVEQSCNYPLKEFCQQCVNLKQEHFTLHKTILLEEILKDSVQQRRIQQVEKEYNKLNEIAQQEATKIDQQFGSLFKTFFQESEQTKEKLKNKYVYIYKKLQEKMHLIKQQNLAIQQRVLQNKENKAKQSGGFASIFGKKKDDSETLISNQQQLMQFLENNKDKIEMTIMLNELNSMIKQKLNGIEIYKPNFKEVQQEFEYQVQQVMAMLLDNNLNISSRNSMQSFNSISNIVQTNNNDSFLIQNQSLLENVGEEYLAFINENNDIQINNELVIETLKKVERLPHINQQVLEKMNLKLVGPVYQDKFIFYGQTDPKKNQKMGRGKLVNRETGALYEGYFRDDVPFGIGRIILQNGDYYEGFTQNAKPEGKGMLVLNQGKYIFNGEFKNGLKHGIGEEQRENGVVIKGSYKNNVLDNNMTILIQYKDGSYYQGQHVNGQIEGEGQIIYKNGEKYYGQFQAGKKQGQGIYQFLEGHKYEGHFFNDLPNGEGIFYYVDGVLFKGEFLNGLQHGRGVEINKEKNIQKVGEWNQGLFVRWII